MQLAALSTLYFVYVAVVCGKNVSPYNMDVDNLQHSNEKMVRHPDTSLVRHPEFVTNQPDPDFVRHPEPEGHFKETSRKTSLFVEKASYILMSPQHTRGKQELAPPSEVSGISREKTSFLVIDKEDSTQNSVITVPTDSNKNSVITSPTDISNKLFGNNIFTAPSHDLDSPGISSNETKCDVISNSVADCVIISHNVSKSADISKTTRDSPQKIMEDNPTDTEKDINGISIGDQWIPNCHNGMFCHHRCYGDGQSSLFPENNYNKSNTGIPAISGWKEIPLLVKGMSFLSLSQENDPENSLKNFAKMCNCDRKCVLYGDCCPDFFKTCLHLTSTEDIEKFIVQTRSDILGNVSNPDLIKALRLGSEDADSILDKLYVTFGSCRVADLFSNKYVMFVDRCPNGVEQLSKEACENTSISSLKPVTLTLGNTRVTFINKFCAFCHGVSEDELTSWKPFLLCDGEQIGNKEFEEPVSASLLVEAGLCNVSFQDNIIHQERTCYRSQEDFTSENLQYLLDAGNEGCSKTDLVLCQSYYVFISEHRNPHCQKCLDAIRRSRRETDIQDISKIENELVCTAKSSTIPSGGMFIVFDFPETITHVRHDRHMQPNVEYMCAGTQVFDEITKQCKTLFCQPGQRSNSGQCISLTNSTNYNEIWQMFKKIWTGLKVSIKTQKGYISCDNFTEEFLKSSLVSFNVDNLVISRYKSEVLDTEMSILAKNVSGKLKFCNYRILENMSGNSSMVELSLTLKQDLNLISWKELKGFPEMLFFDEFEMTVTSLDNLSCDPGLDRSLVRSFTLDSTREILSALINFTDQEISYPLQSVGLEMQLTKTSSNASMTYGVISTCEFSQLLFRKNCRVVVYVLDDSSFNNSFKNFERKYGKGNVEVKGRNVYVCLVKANESFSTGMTYIVVSWAMSSASVLSLMLMFIIYCMCPELCNLPGKMTQCLAGTLLVVTLLAMLSTIDLHHELLCPVAAVIHHILFLAQYGWMSAIALNLAFTFGPKSKQQINSLNNKKTFIKYSIAVWGLSIAIVSTPVTLDLLHSDSPTNEDLSICSNSTTEIAVTMTLNCTDSPRSNDFPSYGIRWCTWFSGPLWVVITFVTVPFVVSYITNVICFATTLAGIHNSNRQATKLGKKSANRMLFVIYIKLSTAMGFIGALGIPVNYLDSSNPLSYIFSSLALLQGVFLFLAFMVNKRVLSVIRRRWHRIVKTLKISKGTNTNIISSSI